MNNKIITTLLLSLTILLLTTQITAAGFQPIYPLEENIIGGQYRHSIASCQPYIKGAYDFEHNQNHYQLGTKYKINEQLTTGINYRSWLNHNLPGYLYQQGGAAKAYYQPNLNYQLNCSLFSGQVGEEFSEGINTSYLTIAYDHELYSDWENRVQLKLDVVSGQERESDTAYYVSKLKLPVKWNQFTLIPQLGYIKPGNKIKPHYNLTNHLPGYESEIGTKLASFKLEHQFELVPYSSWPVINLLNGITFITAGDLLTKNETVADFNLHSSTGAGLALNMGRVDFELTKVITDRGTTKTLFQVTTVY